ncbi:uncharacterized protein LOC122572058 isoform X1 [Bombus pyrosoma]|uniref:uncharacterized protein LOC122572058 isoform X1 n=1 Tax=Bombus pyrosoma TaxID=396416 RepID=UPI001CB8AE18|nr:uncharacterized protein LOC122572058 isoform X1 [Bombus pyrosoma]
MPQCIVNNCRNSMRSHLVLGKTKKKKKKKRIMSHIIGLEAESVKTEVRICSAHFAEDAFYLIHGTKRPRPGALPSKGSNSSMLSPSARKFRRKKFPDGWLNNPNFARWLQRCGEPYKAKCSVCNKIITAEKSKLLKHKNGLEHMTLVDIREKAAASIRND